MVNKSYFKVYQLYTEEEVKQIRSIIDKLEWTPGKARTEKLTELLKRNEELLPSQSETVNALCKTHSRKLADNMDIKTDHILKGVSPPKFNRYSFQNSTYERHVDAPVMKGVRTDLASTTFFTDADECVGGELNIEDSYGHIHTFKGNKGQCVVYPCGNPHWVTPIQEGERISIICWIQSYIRDISNRNLLSSMIKTLHKIEDRTFEDPVMREVWTELGAVHAALFKKWME